MRPLDGITVVGLEQAVAAPFAAPPSPARWVTDEAGFLSAGAREALDARLGAYQQQSGHQLLLWIGHTVGEMAVEDYTVRTFAAWRVGRKGIDDGLVLFIFTGSSASVSVALELRTSPGDFVRRRRRRFIAFCVGCV